MKQFKISYTFEGRLKSKTVYAKTKISAENHFYKNMKQYLNLVEILCVEETAEVIYGIWNSIKKEFQFGIREKTPNSAINKLFKKIGDDARKFRFKVKPIELKRMEEHR